MRKEPYAHVLHKQGHWSIILHRAHGRDFGGRQDKDANVARAGPWGESHHQGMKTAHSEENLYQCDHLDQRISKLALTVDDRRVFVR